MNRRIAHLHFFVLVLFGALIVAVTYWQIWAAPSLATRQANPRLVFRELSVDRGTIATADGVVLARNRRVRQNGRTLFYRTYPQDGLAAQWVGYSSIAASRAGLEEEWNDYLTGANGDLASGLEDLLDKARGQTIHGDNLVLNLSAQGAARGAGGPARERAARRRRRARADHRRRAGDGVVADVRPQRRRPRPPAGVLGARRAGPQPRHAGPLPAGLDVQGRDGGDRARRRQGDAGHPLPRALLHRHDGPAPVQLPRRDAGAARLPLRPRALHQHHVRPGRQGTGEADARRRDGALRLRLQDPHGLPQRPDRRLGPVPTGRTPAAAGRPDRRRAHRDRPGAPARDAAPDVPGGGRGGERRQARGAAAGEGGALAGRHGRRAARAARARPGDDAVRRPAPSPTS